MYHNWYALYIGAKQAQNPIHSRADDGRLADAARKNRKEREETHRDSPPSCAGG